MSSLPPPFTLLLGNLPTFVRAELTRQFQNDPDLRVVGTAMSTDELAVLARRLRPGVVVIGEENLLVLEQLRRQFPVPVLLYSARVPLPGMLREVTRLGVYDYVPAVPTAEPELGEWRRAVKQKLLAAKPKAAPLLEISPVLRRALTPVPPRGVVVLGGSTGGAPAVEQVLRELPASFPWAVLVAVHLPAHFTANLVDRLRRVSKLPVQAADTGSALRAGQVLVVPGGCNMLVQPAPNSPWVDWQTVFTSETSSEVPSIDLLMQSVARTAGRNTVGIVLTGLGQDGTLGAHYLRQQGGLVLAQDEASSAVFGMPKSVIEAGLASAVLPLSAMASYLVRHTQTTSAGKAPRYSSLANSVHAR